MSNPSPGTRNAQVLAEISAMTPDDIDRILANLDAKDTSRKILP